MKNDDYEIIPIDHSIKEYIDVNKYNMNEIPKNVSIATITLACYLGTLFKIDNIYKYMVLDTNNIIAIKSINGVRCIDGTKKEFKSLNKNSKKNFYNQITTVMKVNDEKTMNVKLFKNGSIQITGCKDLSDINIILTKLINRLKETIIVRDDAMNECELTFIEEPDKINVTNFKINLINSNFRVNYWINKEQLFNILTSNNIICILSTIHSCVNIKYKIQNEDTNVSIFVFQTGSIIITGAKKPEYIKEAYNFIMRVLNANKQKIIKKNINKLLSQDEFNEIMNSET